MREPGKGLNKLLPRPVGFVYTLRLVWIRVELRLGERSGVFGLRLVQGIHNETGFSGRMGAHQLGIHMVPLGCAVLPKAIG